MNNRPKYRIEGRSIRRIEMPKPHDSYAALKILGIFAGSAALGFGYQYCKEKGILHIKDTGLEALLALSPAIPSGIFGSLKLGKFATSQTYVEGVTSDEPNKPMGSMYGVAASLAGTVVGSIGGVLAGTLTK